MKLNKDNSLLSLSFSWQSAVSDIAFLLIIFFILTATFGLNRIIIFENNNSQQKIINAKDIVTICLKSDGTLFYNQKIVTNDKLKYFLNKKNNYILDIHDSVKYRDFIKLLDIFEEKEITNFQISDYSEIK